jgi:nitric oxide reductase activation protein
MRTKPIVSMLALSLLAWFPAAAKSQAERPPIPRTDVTAAPPEDNEARDRMAHDMAKKANEERAAALKADTDKLLKLATELKASVDKSNENILSVDVIKKADEIEKLARSVKDKMKGPN